MSVGDERVENVKEKGRKGKVKDNLGSKRVKEIENREEQGQKGSA
jgi:hypothetical protein